MSINVLTSITDISSYKVIDWIDLFGYEYNIYFINDKNTFFNKTTIELPHNSKDTKVYWVRRFTDILDKNNLMFVNTHYFCNKDKFWLNNPTNIRIEKGLQLVKANEFGLKIPKTLISDNQDMLLDFYDKNNPCIIKYNNQKTKIIKNKIHGFYTNLIDREFIENLSDIQLCILQEYIEKEIEIRSFFLDGDFYSMAIFSQNNTQTKIDYRRYNVSKPNRIVPYLLPKDIENKLKNMFKSLNLNCGSLDLIKTPSQEYYFLEVNPFGQFDMLSKACNYSIEKCIAKKLINEYKKNI